MPKAPRNKTLQLSNSEKALLKKRLIRLDKGVDLEAILNRTIHQNMLEALDHLPNAFVDLVFVDPPYNLSKRFNKTSFKEMESEAYETWLEEWLSKIPRILKPNASVYICGDWKSSAAIYNVARKYFHIQNRITFEREKGRGAKTNWKNASEDIWFCTLAKDYYFNADAVKMKRKVLAPYKDKSGNPKDWKAAKDGNFRLTFPSNLWTDISIPFWSMAENTDHPTQKPEKLVAKILLASSQEGDVVFDPFLGSGTTSVVAKKLNRQFVGIELDEDFACIAEKRLAMAQENTRIQGYEGGVFWERNSGAFSVK